MGVETKSARAGRQIYAVPHTGGLWFLRQEYRTMTKEKNCQCVVCQVEQDLLDSLSTQTARSHFQALARNYPVLNHFDSPADVIARLHEHEKLEAVNHNAWNGILCALVNGIADRTTEDIGQQLLLVAYTPAIHKVCWEVCRNFQVWHLQRSLGFAHA